MAVNAHKIEHDKLQSKFYTRLVSMFSKSKNLAVYIEGLVMLYECKTEKMNLNIDYDAIKAEKNEMMQRFLLAKKKAEQTGEVVAKPIWSHSS